MTNDIKRRFSVFLYYSMASHLGLVEFFHPDTVNDGPHRPGPLRLEKSGNGKAFRQNTVPEEHGAAPTSRWAVSNCHSFSSPSVSAMMTLAVPAGTHRRLHVL